MKREKGEKNGMGKDEKRKTCFSLLLQSILAQFAPW